MSRKRALVLRDIMFALFINTPYMLTEPVKQLIAYIVVELIYYGVAIVVMWLVIKLIHKVYVNKKENISGKELILLFATLLTVMVGYFTFNFLSNVYVEDTGNYVWNVHPGYTFLRVIYQIVSFAAILIAVIIYQRIKEKQREENMNLLLAEQIENTKQHISEVEKLYGDIRALNGNWGGWGVSRPIKQSTVLQDMTDNAEKIRQEKLEERKKVEAELKEHFGDRFKGFHVKWSEEDAKAEETEESEIAEDAEKESETIGGSVGVNVGKTARKIAAAKTTSQLRAVIAEIKGDMQEVKAGIEKGWCDESEMEKVNSLMAQAQNRMGQVEDREATPEEENMFAMASLM